MVRVASRRGSSISSRSEVRFGPAWRRGFGTRGRFRARRDEVMACSLTLEEHRTLSGRGTGSRQWSKIPLVVKKSMALTSKITPALCRAARGLLDMNQVDLAAAAMVSKNVIVAFEKGRTNPTRNTLAAIQRVLEEAGVEFTNGDAPGLRLRKKKR